MPSAAPPILLPYAPPALQARPRCRTLFLLLSAPTVVLPALPFAHGVSPYAAIREPLSELPSIDSFGWAIAQLGAPFFAAPLLLLYHTLQRFLAPTATLRRTFCVLAVACWLPFCLFQGTGYVSVIPRFIRSGDAAALELGDCWAVYLSTLVALAGLVLSLRLRRRHDPDAAVSLLLATPFVANAVMCLGSFRSSYPEAGYLLTACLLPIVLADLTLRALPALRRPRPADPPTTVPAGLAPPATTWR